MNPTVTRDFYPYLVGDSEGRATLDAARAAVNLPQASASKNVAVWGWSQGGQGALFAGQLAPIYAPELKLVGVAAAAPAGELATLLTDANWGWALVALVLSGLTYIAAAMALEGFVPERLHFFRTFQAQLAASFATLISPPTLGAVAVNLRYLQRAGVHPALGAASVGVSQVMAFVVHILMLLGFGVIAGTRQESEFSPPSWAIFVLLGGLAAAVFLLLLPWTRKWITRRIRPIFQQVGPRLLTLLQQPRKLGLGIAGILLLNLGYIACLIASVWAFGGSAPLAAIAVVYLAGATIGQAAPTPGGLGAVEAALSAGLTAAGIPGGIAVSSVLLFRLMTFWLPTIPGWFAFNSLQKNELL